MFGPLTVRENLQLGAFARLVPRRAAARDAVGARLDFVLATFPRLQGAPRPGRRHALGRRAADARDRPRADERARLLLLDEPSMGLAPLIVHQLFEVLRDLQRPGWTDGARGGAERGGRAGPCAIAGPSSRTGASRSTTRAAAAASRRRGARGLPGCLNRAWLDPLMEREYNLRIRHPERDAVYARFASASAALRARWAAASARSRTAAFTAPGDRLLPGALAGGSRTVVRVRARRLLARPRAQHVLLPGRGLGRPRRACGAAGLRPRARRWRAHDRGPGARCAQASSGRGRCARHRPCEGSS